MSQALYRKWRPRSWDEVIGQPHIVQTLRNALATDRIVHAYLFAGPRGTGKTTVARILAKAVNCTGAKGEERPCDGCEICKAVNENRFMDLIEIDGPSYNKVDQIRELIEKVGYSPSIGKYRVYIIDEAHMLSPQAFDAFLKTLEEPPAHTIFILATTEGDSFPSTILSRCQRHNFRRVPISEIIAQLQKIIGQEGIRAEPEALAIIARQATGSVRDAISLLDQLASTGQTISLDLAQAVFGTTASSVIIAMMEAILAADSAVALDALHHAIDAGADPRALARQLVDYLRQLLLVQLGNAAQVDATEEMRKRLAGHASAFSSAEVLRMLRLFNAAAVDPRGGWQPALGLELALAEILEAGPGASEPVAETASGRRSARGPVAQTRAGSAPPASMKSEGPAIDIDPVVRDWKKIVASLRGRNNPLNGLLNSASVLGTREGALVLGLSSDVLVAKLNPEMLAQTSAAIKEHTGMDLPVQCVVFTGKKGLPPDIRQDGMVATALQAGGEIVDVQE